MQKILSLIYPAFCLHCEASLKENHLLCLHCFSLLEFLPMTHKKELFCFSFEGPARTLCMHRSMDRVIEVIAAFMVMAMQNYGIVIDSFIPLDKHQKGLVKVLEKTCGIATGFCGNKPLGIALTKEKEQTVFAPISLFFYKQYS